jgi:hypothetical protein
VKHKAKTIRNPAVCTLWSLAEEWLRKAEEWAMTSPSKTPTAASNLVLKISKDRTICCQPELHLSVRKTLQDKAAFGMEAEWVGKIFRGGQIAYLSDSPIEVLTN